MAIVTNKGVVNVPASPKVLHDQQLGDYNSLLLDMDIENAAIQPGTEPHARFLAYAYAVFGAYSNIAVIAEQTSELTATGQALDNIRKAQGLAEVKASPASGNLTVRQIGPNSILWVAGTEFRTQNGKRGKVLYNQTRNNGESLAVVMIDTGASSNVAYGDEVEWIAPPVNALSKATVGHISAANQGLTGGVDDETDAQKTARIINSRQNPPASGNWGQVKTLAEGASAGIQSAFVYPVLGGPGTFKVVLVKAMQLDPDETRDFSRQVTSELAGFARDAIAIGGPIAAGQTTQLVTGIPDGVKFVVQSAVDQLTEVVIKLALPSPATIGGTSGDGWNDSIQFPTLTDAERFVTVSVVTDESHITVDAMGEAPTNNQTIAWFDASTKEFTKSRILSHGGTTGAYTLVLDTPLTGVATGDLISPACANMDSYAATLLEQMNLLGPGENTSDPVRLAHAKRKPLATSGAANFPARLGTVQTAAIIESANEITDAEIWTSNEVPTVPAALADAPNILTLNNLAFYPLI